jgi:methyltransferase (TIGR00027 family)
MRLSDVSRTAIATLRSRAIESARPEPLIHDPVAVLCLERLRALATDDEKRLLFDRRLSRTLTRHIALRARRYDEVARRFIEDDPSCLVVNLGCGFDTRYFRIGPGEYEYVELDLPEVVELKRQVLGDRIGYEMIGGSVLDHSWIEKVNTDGSRRALLLAEGLLMYLPKPDVVSLLGTMARGFTRSRIVLEVVNERYTRGIMKRIVASKIRRQLGHGAGTSYDFGVRDAREIESYARGLRVVDEWSFVDDPDVRPRILRHLGLGRTQWTVTVEIGG